MPPNEGHNGHDARITMRRNPFEELEEMLERMSRQVEEGVAARAGPGSITVDVRDAPEAFVVTAELPGYESEDVDLTLSGNRLEIEAERDLDGREGDGEAESEGEDGGTDDYVLRERRRTPVSRSVRLPGDVEAEAVEADLSDGVLTVHLPKARVEEGHRIDIDG